MAAELDSPSFPQQLPDDVPPLRTERRSNRQFAPTLSRGIAQSPVQTENAEQ
jgi:hypothetical protein